MTGLPIRRPRIDVVEPIAPIVRYVGGKRELAAQVLQRIPQSIKHYIEPMCGGAAVFLALRARNDKIKAMLGDADRRLIDLYVAVVKDPKAVFAEAADLAIEQARSKDPKAFYLRARARWNEEIAPSPGLHLFLRHQTYNALWRVNRRGELNVPWYSRLAVELIPTLSHLERFAAALEGVVFSSASVLSNNQPDLDVNEDHRGTAFYFDPPYDGAFSAYTAKGFSKIDHELLIQRCARLEAAGGHVVYSNADTPFIRSKLAAHWPTAVIELVANHSTVAASGKNRTRQALEILASSRLR